MMDLMPMRQTFLISEWPAIPLTRVPKSRGAIMVLIRRKKIWLRTCKCTVACGQSWPNSPPTSMLTRIQGVRERRKKAYAIRTAIAVQRAVIRTPSGIGSAWKCAKVVRMAARLPSINPANNMILFTIVLKNLQAIPQYIFELEAAVGIFIVDHNGDLRETTT